MTGIHFYRDLKPLQLPITEVFQPSHFCDLPSDWFIIIADVKNSTEAVQAGRHNDVNLVAAGSLIAGLNIAREQDVDVPFFFGGDGGVLLVPHAILKKVLAGLHAHKLNSARNFSLDMHIGSLPVKEIEQAGHFIKIAKVFSPNGLHKSVVVGDGFRFAEQAIKEKTKVEAADPKEPAKLNLTGLECRWDKVKPPADENEVVCFLIECLNPAQQMETYSKVLRKADEIYGDETTRNPLSMERLKLLITYQKIKKEMMAKHGRWNVAYFLSTFFFTFLGRFYFRYNWNINNLRGQEYLRQLISNADILTIDGRINTIITGKSDKRIQFLNYLSRQEQEGNLIYGHHISKESIMTCYIENRNAKHIHFVDGSDGGYTEAAKEFKRKFKQSISQQ